MVKNNIPIFSEIMFPNNNAEKQKEIYLTEEWLKLSDFYNGTIQCNYFNSPEDIIEKTHQNPIKTNISNKDLIYNNWSSILKQL